MPNGMVGMENRSQAGHVLTTLQVIVSNAPAQPREDRTRLCDTMQAIPWVFRVAGLGLIIRRVGMPLSSRGWHALKSFYLHFLINKLLAPLEMGLIHDAFFCSN